MKPSDTTLEVKTMKGNMIIKLKNVMYIKAINKHSLLFIEGLIEYESINNLGYYERILPQPYFFRIHKTCIINCMYIERINHSAHNIILKNSNWLQISRYRKQHFLNNLHKYYEIKESAYL